MVAVVGNRHCCTNVKEKGKKSGVKQYVYPSVLSGRSKKKENLGHTKKTVLYTCIANTNFFFPQARAACLEIPPSSSTPPPFDHSDSIATPSLSLSLSRRRRVAHLFPHGARGFFSDYTEHEAASNTQMRRKNGVGVVSYACVSVTCIVVADAWLRGREKASRENRCAGGGSAGDTAPVSQLPFERRCPRRPLCLCLATLYCTYTENVLRMHTIHATLYHTAVQ
jgi:hypothetical protein